MSEDISVVTVGVCRGEGAGDRRCSTSRCTARTCHLRCPWWQQAQRGCEMQAQQGRERRPAGPARGADHCGHLSLSCSPKALAGGRGSGCMGSGAPRAFRTPPAPAAAPTGPRAQPADAAQGSPPPRPPGSLPSSGGPWASARELGATCVPISPLASQPLPPHAPSSPALGLLRVPWAATGQASSPLQGALPKLTLRAPPCSVTLMGPFSVLGVPGRAACSTARQLGGGGGRDPSPRLLSFANHLLCSELPVKRWARVITALGGDVVTLLSLLLGPPTSPGQPWAHSRHSG